MKSSLQKLRRLVFYEWTVPIALAVLGFASFGLRITKLGFYWDDWAQLLVSRLYGLSYYWAYFAYDRPLSAWTHILFVPILGGSPLNWQVFTLSLRILSACAMAWALIGLWPKARRQVFFASFLFLIYPAFTQQSDAVAYHQHWFQYLLFFVSIGLMIRSIGQSRRRFWLLTCLSLITLALHLSITEFFTGAELIRPVILWMLLSVTETDRRQRLGKTIRFYLPYALVLLIYLAWRLVYIPATTAAPHSPVLIHQLLTQPWAALLTIGQFVLKDMLDLLVGIWSNVLDLHLFDASQIIYPLSWLLSLVVALAAFIYLSRLKDRNADNLEDKKWAPQAALLGALVTLLGPAPIWVAGNQLVDPDYRADRFALVAMFGIALLFVALIEWIGKKQAQKAIILAVLIGLSAGFHLRTANDYRWQWTYETRFYWQLYWRAPSIQQPTAIISEGIFLPHQDLFSTSSAINLLYPQPSRPKDLAYWMYTIAPRFKDGIPTQKNLAFSTTLRIYHFTATIPEQSILIQFDPYKSRCLWVLSAQDQKNPVISERTRQALFVSNLSRIQNSSSVSGYPPTEYFGKELSHDWCYYFEKADLARQESDWNEVVKLGDQAGSQGYKLVNPASAEPREWMPFIEGYARMDRFPAAQGLTQAIADRYPPYKGMLCDLWTNVEKTAAGQLSGQASGMARELGCSVSGVDEP